MRKWSSLYFGTAIFVLIATSSFLFANNADFHDAPEGDVKHEMPSWASLLKDERWKIVTYVKAMNAANTPATGTGSIWRVSYTGK